MIYAAYAKVNPQQAYSYSANLFDWGSGNSASNQLYFVATQSSASDICSAGAQTPEGLYTIQAADSGLYVTVAGNGALAATTNADVLASKFELGFTPGGGTIQALATGLFITASPNGDAPLSAAREVPGSYETFRWALQPDGSYHLTAMVNRAQVTSSSSEGGLLINNANSTNGIPPTSFRLVPAESTAPVDLPATGFLRSVEKARLVVSDPVLRTTSVDTGSASRLAFSKVPDSPEQSPSYTIQNIETGQFVTGNMDGSVPLSATAPTPQAWEHFQFVPYQGSYIILHIASGKTVASQPDDTLMDNTDLINDSTLWQLIP